MFSRFFRPRPPKYVSEYEAWLYKLWDVLGHDKYTFNEVDGALIGSQVDGQAFYHELTAGRHGELSKRFFTEIEKIRNAPNSLA